MNHDDIASPTEPDPASGLAAKANGGHPGLNGADALARSRIRTWALALAAGLAAGAIAWFIGEVGMMPDSGHARAQGNADAPASVVGLHDGVVAFGALGAATGLGLGLAGGLSRRSAVRAVSAAAAGLILGGVTGAGMAQLLIPAFYKNLSANDLTISLMVHGGSWGAVGAVAGLAFGTGLGGWGRILRATVGGLGAALVATVIYEFAGGILFPLATTDQPLSATSESRLVARLLVTLMVAVGVVLSAGAGGSEQER